MDYNNPNDYWLNHQPMNHEDVDSEAALKSGCFVATFYVAVIAIILLAMALFGSCTTTKYVPVIETHENHHWHTDSVKQKDSIIRETQTTIMQLDSAGMAKYGIQLKAAERAWLVQTSELERQIQELARMVQSRDTVRDSIPVPYPVEKIKEVEKQLTWWQQKRMLLGDCFLLCLLLFAFFKWGIPFIKKLILHNI